MPHSPAPWRFHNSVYGLTNVIVDDEKRVLVCHVPECDGALIAAAPTIFAVLKKIATKLPEGDELGDWRGGRLRSLSPVRFHDSPADQWRRRRCKRADALTEAFARLNGGLLSPAGA